MPTLARKLVNRNAIGKRWPVAVNCDGAAQVPTASRVQQHFWTAAQSHAHSRQRGGGTRQGRDCGCSLAGRRDVGARFKTVARLLLLSLRFEGDGNVFQNRVRSQVPQGHRPARSSCRCMWWRTTCRTEPACWKPYSIKSPVRMDAGVDAADRSVFHYTNSGFASLASYESAAEQAC